MAITLSQKLQLKPEQALTLLNAPETMESFLQAEGVPLSGAIPASALLLFVNNRREAETLRTQAVESLQPEGMLWVAYPKGTSGVKTDINRDSLWPIIQAVGWKPIRQVALDKTWSALRFKPECVS
jgi:hypothetical protein